MVIKLPRVTKKRIRADWDDLICPEPSCWTPLDARLDGSLNECPRCGRLLTLTAGLPDVRDTSDRYLPLDAERRRAELLDTLAQRQHLSALDLARVYYAITGDPRRERFLAHLDRAEVRAEGLVSQICEHVPYGGRVLEIGCGSGGFLAAAARVRSDWRLEGVDLASRWLVVAKRRLRELGFVSGSTRTIGSGYTARASIRLIAAQAERLPFRHGWFDAAVADSLVEHLDDPQVVVTELRRVVRPGGRVILWSPNRRQWLDDPHGVRQSRSLRPPCIFSSASPSSPFWKPRCRTAREAASWFDCSAWSSVVVQPASVTRRWLSQAAHGWERLHSVYAVACRQSLLRSLLTEYGPLWQLTAIRSESNPCR
ncbi:Methyltransferase type 11 [Isosphaera pallida ATCC 43644]|uniref:Methyltransferase type 11 n=1 Tax=Isosphaera pallida (strain ATCC 43644 / DSM 9630 / IS1B) TaxID=575540 RepID=E8R068_ISOPI|nr:methyltransferase domain-containing protein [Isosphaera pallida]ADV61186.1 Methyltransferase type 11 [Isosphaera pallida ATCC 43644]